MFRRFIVTFLLSMSFLPRLGSAAEPAQRNFVFGVMPYHSARVLMEHHRPVLLFLRDELQQEVRIETASGFQTFYDNTVKGEYDLVAIAAHFARLLQVEKGYVPLVRYSTGGRCNIMVRKDSDISRVQQLRGKLVATPDRLALGSVVCLQTLERQGLRADRDYRVQDMATFNSAALAVERGDADAAVSAPAALMQMRPEQRDNLRMLIDADEYANLVYLAHPRVAAGTRDKLRTGLLRFSEESAGRAFFTATGFGSFVPVSPEVMKSSDAYLTETRRLLRQAQK